MRVRVLGGLTIEGVPDRDLGSRKARTMVKVLALARGAPVPVDRLADVLWADALPARPVDQVGVLASRLRRVVGTDRLVRTDAGYALRVDWLDLDELVARAEAAAAALAEGRVASAASAADAALALARGPVLPDDEGDWVTADRRAAERTLAAVGVVAAEAALTAGDPARAVVAAASALARDPVDEAALRALMRAHLGAGRPASALAAYAEVRARLADELGVSPTRETEAVHDEVLVADAEPRPAPVLVKAAPPTPVVLGRDDELSALAAVVARVEAGGGAAAVCVVGEPGIGKTALVEEVARRAATTGAVVLRARCDDLGRDLPLQPIVDALARTGSAPDVGPGVATAGADGEGDVEATVLADGQEGRARLYRGLRGDLERAAAGRLAVLVVDDLHRASALTLGWLGYVGAHGTRVVVLATARPPAPAVVGAEVVELGPLAPAVAGRLVGADAPADAVARADGNPLFLLALAEAPRGPLPTSVSEVAQAQADDLGAPAADAVRTAACLGTVVDLDLVAAVLDRPAVAVLADLEAARAAGLLVERGSALVFRHELVREALDHAAGAVRRAFAHRQAARALAARDPVDPLAVAVHARLGGDRALAADGFLRAAEVAAARFDPATAIELLGSALALVPSAAARVARARARMSALDLDGAAADAAEAVALGGAGPALEVSAWVAYYQRRYDAAVLAADEGEARARDDGGLRASCLAVSGRVRHGRGDLAGADARLGAVGAAPPQVRGVVDVWLAHVRLHQGRPDDALHLADRALLDGDHLAHPWAPLHGRFARVMALGHRGDLDGARRACDDLDRAVARAGSVGTRFVPVAANLRAWLLGAAGRADEAVEASAAARAATTGPDGRPAADRLAEAFWVAHLDEAEVHLARDDAATAASWVERAAPIDRWEGTMAWHQRHRLDLLRARLLLLDGDADTAAHLTQGVADDADRRGAGRYHALASAWLVVAGGDAPVDEVVAALGRAAALDGWPVVAALAAATGRPDLRVEAERRAAALVAQAGPLADPLRTRAATVFG